MMQNRRRPTLQGNNLRLYFFLPRYEKVEQTEVAKQEILQKKSKARQKLSQG